jgi:hypothetical protein
MENRNQFLVISLCLVLSSCTMIPVSTGSRSDLMHLEGLRRNALVNGGVHTGSDVQELVADIKKRGGTCGKYVDQASSNSNNISCYYASCSVFGNTGILEWEMDMNKDTATFREDKSNKYEQIKCDGKRNLKSIQEALAVGDGREII